MDLPNKENTNIQPINDMFIDRCPEYVYLTIPTLYICTYHKILHYMVDFGIDLVKDCGASCNAKNKKILDCWSMFQSACAAYTLTPAGEEPKKANLLIKYINEQLELIYESTGEVVYNGDGVYPITNDGHFKAMITCRTPLAAHTEFHSDDYECRINHKDGHMYVKFLNKEQADRYEIQIQPDGCEHIIDKSLIGHLTKEEDESED